MRIMKTYENRKKLAVGEAVVSLILSMLAVYFISFHGVIKESVSNGISILTETGQFEPISLIWVLLSLCTLIGIAVEKRKVVFLSAITMLIFTVLTLLSIGLYFVPASLMLIIATVTYSLSKRRDKGKE